MHDRLKETADELQAAILKEAKETYSPEVVERWLRPRNWGAIEKPDGFSKITGPCGDTMQITLKVDSDRVTEVRYITDGCATTIASGSMATELAQTKTLDEALDINEDTILEALGGLPWESEHCALLAASVLRAAIRDYRKSKKEKE
jgi:nitrogen fixation protein NifU and related proteins